MNRRYKKKRRKLFRPWQYGRDDFPEIHSALNDAHKLFDGISDQLGKDIAEKIFSYVLKGPTKSERKFEQQMALVKRLLEMPGDSNQNKLARILAEESGVKFETAKQQIKDALNAVREYQEATDNFIPVNSGRKRIGTSYGISWFS